MTASPPTQSAPDAEAVIAELRAKAHASTRHSVRHRTPTPLKEHVCWRAADALEAARRRVGVLEGELRRIKAMRISVNTFSAAQSAFDVARHIASAALEESDAD